MTYAVYSIADDEYILLEYTGEVTREEHETGRRHAIQKLTEHGWRRLLVDARRIAAQMSVVDDFEFTVDNVAIHPPLVNIAVVHRSDEAERFRFIEDVAVNRGLNLKVFTDSDEAIDWLIDD